VETNRFSLYLIIFIALSFCIWRLGCAGGSTNQEIKQNTTLKVSDGRISANSEGVDVDSLGSPGQKLALIELGSKRSGNDVYVALLNKLIDSLSHKYNEPKDSIADKTWKVYGALSEMGIKTTFQDILYGANFKGNIKGLKYNDVMHLYYKASAIKAK
jgi:hypothetical protein